MRGRKVFMDTLVAQGVRHIFGNPGTTESPLIDSLIEYPQLSYVMALHEGVALGAASFYAQATGRTPVVNLHVAPGLGNALGAMYSALKANSPMFVLAMTIAPASFTRLTMNASLSDTKPCIDADPFALWRPIVSMLSLTTMGMQWSGLTILPAATRLSIAAASSRIFS